MTHVDRSSSTPLYEQIKHMLREQILNGEIAPGSKVPPEHELCKIFGVSGITVKHALADLARDGLIRRIQGKGTIVDRKMIDGGVNQISGFSQIVRRQGYTPSSRILSVEVKEGSMFLRQLFNIPLDFPKLFTHFRRLMFVDETPAAVLTCIVPEEIGERMRQQELEHASFYSLYEKIQGRKVIRNETILTPIVATPEIAQLLEVNPGSAHFHFRGLSYLEGDIPIELSVGVFSGNIFEWNATLYAVREKTLLPEKLSA